MRKGSLSLSINAIVVLIMAVALLGLGLGFLRSMFSNLEGQLGDIAKDTEQRMVQGLEDSNARLALDKTKFEIGQGKKGETYFGLRNELSTQKTFSINGEGTIDAVSNPGKWNTKSVITCYNSFSSMQSTGFTLGSNVANTAPIFFTAMKSRSLNSGESYVGKLIIQVNGRAPIGTYDCSVIIVDPDNPNNIYDRIDFEVTVTR